MAKVHVKINDNVFVLSGKDQGKTGKVLRVDPQKGRIVVEGVNMATKHKRPDMRLKTGGIIHQENPIDASNVMLVCPKCKRPVKVGAKILENGEKIRVCKSCGATLESLRADDSNKMNEKTEA